jgi:aminopeptidase-like protein
MLNRTAVNEDTDKLVKSIQSILDCDIIEIPSGKECLTWIIPKHWKVHEAYLARMDDNKIVDYKENPLHLWQHSISFKGEISRNDLENHLFYDKKNPDLIPYHYRNGYKYDAEDWGFSLPYNQYLSLNDDKYIVNINTDLDTNGTMKIADYWIKGQSSVTIFFAAHTCHPGQVTDGLSNIAVLLALFMHLKKCKNLYYSYRLILGPEYFSAAGFLSVLPESEIALLKGGVYLDFLGNNQPYAYQSSFQGNSIIDKAIHNVFEHHVPYYSKHDYRDLCGNDEIFYSGQGFFIPTAGINCKVHPEYHLSSDNLELININQLDFSLETIKKIINILENDYVPIPKFKGPIYLSRYNLYVDPQIDRKGYNSLEYIQILMDGELSCFCIADKLGIDFFFVKKFCDSLASYSLIEKKHINLFTKNT